MLRLRHDSHGLSHFSCLPNSLVRRLIQAAMAARTTDRRRTYELFGRGGDDRTWYGHSGTMGEVARALSVIAAGSAPLSPNLRGLASGRSRLTGKASEPSRDACYPLSYLSWQGLAKSSAGSEQMASWFTGWVCHADVMQGLAGCSAFLRKACGKRGYGTFLGSFNQSDGPGEPSGAIWRPRGRPRRPPKGPDGHGRVRRHFPGWEKG